MKERERERGFDGFSLTRREKEYKMAAEKIRTHIHTHAKESDEENEPGYISPPLYVYDDFFSRCSSSVVVFLVVLSNRTQQNQGGDKDDAKRSRSLSSPSSVLLALSSTFRPRFRKRRQTRVGGN